MTFSELFHLHPALTVGICVLAAVMVTATAFRRGRSRRRDAERRISRSRHRRLQKIARKTLATVRRSPENALDVLAAADHFVFEYVITLAYADCGHPTRKLRRLTGDGGIDGMVQLDGRWHVLQAKRYTGRLGSATVRTFIEATQRWRMPGILITSGGYTSPAKRLGTATPRITLLDGRALIRMICHPQ